MPTSNQTQTPVICSLCGGEGWIVVDKDIARCYACNGNGFVYEPEPEPEATQYLGYQPDGTVVRAKGSSLAQLLLESEVTIVGTFTPEEAKHIVTGH